MCRTYILVRTILAQTYGKNLGSDGFFSACCVHSEATVLLSLSCGMEAWQEKERVGMERAIMRVGTFNAGVMQSQLTGRNKKKVLENVNKIICDAVQDGRLHMMSLCEVGGFKEGFQAAGICPRTLPVLSPKYGGKHSIAQNYMTCWNFQSCATEADASQPGFKKLRDLGVFVLTAYTEPQLVVEVFSFNNQVKLIKGNLHIRIPTGVTVTRASRIRLTTQALNQMDVCAKQEQDRYSDASQHSRFHNDASQPIVCLLVGDTNLKQTGGEEAVQPLQAKDSTWDHA